MNERRTTNIMMQVICVICALMVLFPILYAFSASFMRPEDILTTSHYLLPPHPTLANYIQAFTTTKIARYMGNSFIIALICSCVRVILASMAAFSFSFYEFRGKRILFALTLATIMIPPDVLVVQNYVTISKMGLMNTYAGICSIFLISANNIFLMRQNFLTFSRSLQEASRLDGCSDLQFFFRILLPVSRPVLITVFMNSFVSVWNQYVWPMLVTTKDEMRTVQVGITMLKDRESSAFGPVMAGASIALVPTILIFALFLRRIVSGMMTGAVKE